MAMLALFHWRTLWVIAAVMVLAVLPVLLMLLRNERVPSADADAESAAGMDGRHWTRSEMLRHWLFWAMLPMMIGPPTFITVLFFHQVHLAEIKGLEHLALVAMFPIYTACSVSMIILSGIALDRYGAVRLMSLTALPLAASFALVGFGQSLWAIGTALAFVGMSAGAFFNLSSAFWAEIYGTRNLGAIKSVASALMVLGSAIGPVGTGLLIDMGLGLDIQMLMIGGYFLAVAGIVVLAIRRISPHLAPTREVDVVGA